MSPGRGALFLFIFAVIFSPILGYNVLMICPFPTKSHYNLCRGVVDPLIDRGHEVTFVSGYKTEKSKFRDLSIPELVEIKVPDFNSNTMSVFDKLNLLSNFQRFIHGKIFSNDQIKNLLSSETEKFDVVIYEHIANDLFSGFGVKFNCPVILLSPLSLNQNLAIASSNPVSIATVPNMMSSYTGKMNLCQRTINMLTTIILEVFQRYSLHSEQKPLYEQHFPEESKIVPFDKLKTLTSGILVNSHPSMGFARPLLPNTIEIGGYHIKEPAPLPKDLKKIIDDAKDGVIYFSMGSVLKSSEITPELKRILFNVLGSKKQTVLWKYEEDLQDKPKNFIIRKWMPQASILAHPNVKLFISHCGLLSHTEAVHFGVPVLAIPIFGDQFHNALLLEDRGNGLKLEFTNVTETSLEWALTEALDNPKYENTAKEINRIYHDRPMRPRDFLTFHVESIIRSKGAKHLSPAPLSLYSILLLDAVVVILIPLVAIDAFIVYIFWKCCCRNKINKVNEKEPPKTNKKKKQ